MKKCLFLIPAIALIACGDSKLERENKELEEEIEERREALDERQKTELADARQELTLTDSLLTEVRRQHDELHKKVMASSGRLTDKSPEVIRLNNLRGKRDSLEVEYKKQSHKVKFFLKKMNNRL